MCRSKLLYLAILLLALSPAFASAETLTTPVAPRPIVPPDPAWAGVLLIAIAALFVLAMVVGPIVRAIAPEHYAPAAPPAPH